MKHLILQFFLMTLVSVSVAKKQIHNSNSFFHAYRHTYIFDSAKIFEKGIEVTNHIEALDQDLDLRIEILEEVMLYHERALGLIADIKLKELSLLFKTEVHLDLFKRQEFDSSVILHKEFVF